jgi:hypothetical protein
MSDSFLSNAGWLFFAGWSLVIVAISIAAFARDIFPSKTALESKKTQPSDQARTIVR